MAAAASSASAGRIDEGEGIGRTIATTDHKRRIVDLLDSNQIAYRLLHHEATPTSEDSARARGEDLSTGGKAIVLKLRERETAAADGSNGADTGFALFVLSASRKLHTKSIKKELGSKKIRFATGDELAELTGGLVPGSVPPFGRPIVPALDLFVDTSIGSSADGGDGGRKIAFNCGSLTSSIVMDAADYLRVAEPARIFSFSKE